MLVREDSRGKGIFDFVMIFFNAYSCITSIFYVAFEPPDRDSTHAYFDLLVEALFVIDIILHFLTTYRDPDTYAVVRSHAKIAKRYVL